MILYTNHGWKKLRETADKTRKCHLQRTNFNGKKATIESTCLSFLKKEHFFLVIPDMSSPSSFSFFHLIIVNTYYYTQLLVDREGEGNKEKTN